MPAREVDLYDVKADALAALAAMGAPAENIQVTADPPSWYHPGRAGTLRLGPTVLGAFGELHPAVLDALDARPPIAGFEVFLDAVPRRAPARAKPPLRLSVFQPIERDFAFVVDRDLPAETLLRAARGVDRKLVSEIRLFDVYEGTGLPEGKKSLAITVVLQPQERTLTDAEIEGFSKRLSRRSKRRPAASCERDETVAADGRPDARVYPAGCRRLVRSCRPDRHSAILGLPRGPRGGIHSRPLPDR